MRRGRRPTVLAAAAGLLLAAGCAGTPADHDPLTGGPPLPRKLGGAAPAPPSAPLVGAVPPLPPPTSATSPAALASGAAGRPIDPTRELRLSDTPAVPAARPGAPAPGATLQGVQPLEGGSARLAPTPAPALTLTGGFAPAPAAAGGSFEQLQALLAARGVTWQRLESLGDGEWQFRCAVPRPENPSMRTHYEARAFGPHGLAAVRAALDTIDRSRGLAGR